MCSIIIEKIGTYKVRLISFHKRYTDTIYETFILKPLKPLIGKDTNFCKSKFLSLSPNEEYAAYKWSTSQTIKSIYITNPGTYYLTVSDYSGCKGSDTIMISKPLVKANFIINASNQCFRINDFKLKENTTYTGGVRQKSSWFLNDSIISSDTLVNLSFKNIGTYPIKLLSESYSGCRDSITKTLNVFPNIQLDFTINDSLQCLNTNHFNFTNTTNDTGNISYQWDLGDQTMSLQKNLVGKTYSNDSFYKISLVSTTVHNCNDTIVKRISVLPNPKGIFNWDLACSRTASNFIYTGTKPVKTFQWNFNNEATLSIENPSYKFASAGTSIITLIIAADNGCTDTLTKTIEIKPQSKADFTTRDICETDTAVFINKSLDATGYKWKFGDANTSNSQNPKHKFLINSTTTFNVTLVAIVSNGCSDSITKAITVNQNPNSNFSHTLTGTKLEVKANITGLTLYKWKFGSTDSTTTSSPTYIHSRKSEQNKICLLVTDLTGCTSETCKDITVGISALSKNSFKLYPNPNTGNFTIELDNPTKDLSFEIYDLLGNLVKIVKTSPTKSIYLVDLNVANGIYLVKVKNGDIVINQKIIVSK